MKMIAVHPNQKKKKGEKKEKGDSVPLSLMILPLRLWDALIES